MDTFKLVLLGGAATAALTLARPSVAEVPAPPAAPAQTLEFAQAAPDSTTQHVELRPATPAEARQKPTTSQKVERGQAPAGDTKTVQFHDQVYQFTLRHGDEQPGANGDRRADPAVRLAQQDVPAPPAVAAAPAPPAVTVQPVPPAAPAPALPPAPPRPGANGIYSFRLAPVFPDGRAMTPEQRADLDRKLAAIGPAIDKAIADAHIDETVQRALSAQDAKTREEVAKQLQQIGPRIQQAVANAHIREVVAARMAEIQPQIEAAMAQARENSRHGLDQAAQAEERNAQRLEEQAKRARERAQRDRERYNAQPQPAQPAQPPKN
jgi:hypothetical protein